MKSTSSHSDGPAVENPTSCSETSETDWDYVMNMRDEDIIIDDEHPEFDPAYVDEIIIRDNMKLVRVVKISHENK